MRQNRWRGVKGAGSGRWSETRSSAEYLPPSNDATTACAREDAHVRHCGQFRRNGGDPFDPGLAINALALCEKPPAKPWIVLAKDDFGARPAGGKRRGQARGTSRR